MNDSEKVAGTVKKYRNGLLALGAGIVLENRWVAALGMLLLYHRAVTPEAEEEIREVDTSPLTRSEIGYNRGIFVLCCGMVAALAVASYSLPAAAGVVTATTVMGCWLIRYAMRTEDKADLLRAISEFRQLSEARKYGYTVKLNAAAPGEKELCFRVSPLWLPRHFLVSVLPGEGNGQATASTKTADMPVLWFPASTAGKSFIGPAGVWIAQGGPEILEQTLRTALSGLAANLIEPASEEAEAG